ncbi:MAG: hypothetical protein ACI4QV_01170 [Acutalibacteraceae bacterium]
MSMFDRMNKSYTKEGKGVPKYAREKKGFFKFFEIYFSKFWQITKTNLYFCIIFIPVAVMIGLLFYFLGASSMNPYLKWFVIFAPVILLGPGIAGMKKVTRDFAREVPGFPGDDFKNTAIKYLWPSIAVSALSYIVGWVIIIAVMMYHANYEYSWFYKMGYYISLLVAVVFVFMLYYVYMMMVTVDLSMKNIIKNAAIFAFLCLPKNLLITLCYAVFGGIAVALFAVGILTGSEGICLPICTLYVLFICFGSMSFANSFLTFPSLKKYIIDPYYEDNPDKTAEAVTNPGKVFHNIGEEIKDKELPEYVYENGRLVHRSAIEGAMEFNDEKPDYGSGDDEK